MEYSSKTSRLLSDSLTFLHGNFEFLEEEVVGLKTSTRYKEISAELDKLTRLLREEQQAEQKPSV